MNQRDVIQKSKETKYNHTSWYQNSDKSVYDAIKYFVDSGDFILTLKPSIKSPVQIGLSPIVSYRVKDAVEYCIENIDTHWKYLTIKGDGGSDTGKLKIQTYVAYSNLKELADFIDNM